MSETDPGSKFVCKWYSMLAEWNLNWKREEMTSTEVNGKWTWEWMYLNMSEPDNLIDLIDWWVVLYGAAWER